MNKHKNQRYPNEAEARTTKESTDSRGWRRFFVLYFTLSSLLSVSWAQAVADSVTLAFETQGLSLEAGRVVNMMPRPTHTAEKIEADFYFAYNADAVPHAVLMLKASGGEMAFVKGSAFERVTIDSIGKLNFSTKFTAQPLRQTDTVVLRTTRGSVYKIGDAVEARTSVTFNFEKLR